MNKFQEAERRYKLLEGEVKEAIEIGRTSSDLGKRLDNFTRDIDHGVIPRAYSSKILVVINRLLNYLEVKK